MLEEERDDLGVAVWSTFDEARCFVVDAQEVLSFMLAVEAIGENRLGEWFIRGDVLWMALALIHRRAGVSEADNVAPKKAVAVWNDGTVVDGVVVVVGCFLEELCIASHLFLLSGVVALKHHNLSCGRSVLLIGGEE